MDNLAVKVIQYIKSRNNSFKNAQGMEIDLTPENKLWTCLHSSSMLTESMATSISTEEDAISDFIRLFNLRSVEDIEELGYNQAWIRYLNGSASIDVVPLELDGATITFRIYKSKTIVYSTDLYYYDEVYKHLTLPEDFDEYVTKYTNRLLIAWETSLKIIIDRMGLA